MKNVKLFMLAILVIAASYACNKIDEDIPIDPNVEDATIKDIVVPAGFEWQTMADYNFNITGGSGEVIRITSEDEALVYYKGTYIERSGGYQVNLRLPSFITTVKINSTSVDLVGGTIDFDLSNKATLANYALEFDGIDDSVDLGDIAELNSVQTFTIEGLAYDYNNKDSDYLFSKIVDGNHHIRVRTIGDGVVGALVVEIGDGPTADFQLIYPTYSVAIPTPQWFHWAVTYDGFGGADDWDKVKLYINGLEISNAALSYAGTIPGNTANLASNNAILSSSLGYFNGYMDEFRVWSDVRTPAEIWANRNVKILDPNADASLIAYYRMDSGSGTTLVDAQGTYDGTISGAADWAVYLNLWDSDGDGIADIDDEYWDDPLRAHNNFYPAGAGNMGTVVFEDLWPGTGDYDFNDLVIGYQFKTVTSATDKVTEVIASFEVRAHGAALNNAFAFQLPTADPGILSNVIVSGYSHTNGLVTINGTTHFESGQTFPVVVVMDQVSDLMDQFENTEQWKPAVPYAPITITMSATADFIIDDFDMAHWDPFMIINQDRDLEVHLIDRKPTDKADPAYLGTVDDASDPGNNEYYRTEAGLPWALEFPTAFEWPREKIDITWAYYHFRAWAESGGTQYTDWYSSTAAGYRLDANIY